ncbi:porin [Paraburkholderia sediminicola]|uniref:porin n=1 Tax=Paraburkholderia sediminicola TaxID=458836 RepID=UPI0038B7E0BC
MKLYFVFLLILISGESHAQSSVALYGTIDGGLTYTNRVSTGTKAGSNLQFVSGNSLGENWGLIGNEDLGGGLHTNFVLESGFVSSNGAAAQQGEMFGRQAYVGLSGPWGSVTMGRQWDLIGTTFPFYSIGALTPAGLLAWGLHSYAAGGYVLDDRVWGVSVNNAIKYTSPNIHGLTFAAMYGLGNVAGSFGTNSVDNVVASYNDANLSASVGFITVHNATSSSNLHEYAGGLSYTIDNLKFFGMATSVQLSGGNTPRATTFEAGVTYNVSPAILIGGSYQFQERKDLASANQLTFAADYLLSKRTDVYVAAALGHDHAFGSQVQAAYGAPSDTDAQSAIRIGIRHHF